MLTLAYSDIKIIKFSKKDQAYLNGARFLARKSEARNRHGAVVVKGGRVMGMGWNKFRNDPCNVLPEQIKSHCSVHAESDAIKNAGSNLKGAVIYVARVSRRGRDLNSAPCSRCMTLIANSGIKRVVFTTEDGEWEW